MTYLLAVLAGIAGAVAGWLVSGALAVWLGGLAGMSDFEGGRGMFAFFGVGPLGGLLGLVAGTWTVLRRRLGPAPLARSLARVAGVLAAIAALVGGGLALRLATLDIYTDTLPPMLEFELRLPPDADPAAVEVELQTGRNVGASVRGARRADDGARPVAGGTVALDFKTRSRLLVVALPGHPRRLFRLRLARDPAATAEMCDWQRADFVDAGGAEQPQPAASDDPLALRYRVHRTDR